MEDETNFIKHKVIWGDILPQDRKLIAENNNCCLTKRTRFVNQSIHTVVITFRDGTYSLLKPAASGHFNDTLVICHNTENYLSPISTIDGYQDEVVKLLRRQLVTNKGDHLYWEEAIDINTIMDSRHGVYVNSADIVIGLADRFEFIDFHPFCPQATHNRYLSLGEDFNPMYDTRVSIRLVDNEEHYARLYGIFHNEVIVLNTKKSTTLQSGLWVAGLPKLDTSRSNAVRKDERFNIPDCLAGITPIKLYVTLVQAKEALYQIRNGDLVDKLEERNHEMVIAKIKREKELLEQENNLMRLKYAQEKTMTDEIEARRNKEIVEFKLNQELELEKLKKESLKHSEKYKTLTEALKLTGVALTVGFTIYKLMKK